MYPSHKYWDMYHNNNYSEYFCKSSISPWSVLHALTVGWNVELYLVI